jgi:hypothetical protein
VLVRLLEPPFEQVEERAAALIVALGQYDPQIIWQMLAVSPAAQNNATVLTTLAGVAQRTPVLEYRHSIARLIGQGVADPREAIWRPCLRTLSLLDPAQALVLCMQHVDRGEKAPLGYLLDLTSEQEQRSNGSVESAPYRACLDLLVDTTSSDHASAERIAHIRQILIQEYDSRAGEQAALALTELARFESAVAKREPARADAANLATLYRKHRNGELSDAQKRPVAGLTDALLRLAKRPELRQHVVEIFIQGLGLNLAPEEAAQLADLTCDLQACLFPYTLRPVKEKAGAVHLEEMLAEPDGYMMGSRIITWAYKQGDRITDLVLAGHANGPVCREVSAKLFLERLCSAHQIGRAPIRRHRHSICWSAPSGRSANRLACLSGGRPAADIRMYVTSCSSKSSAAFN